MKKLNRSDSLVDATAGWVKASDYLYVHASGARIERRGYPGTPGWYLIFPKEGDTIRRFEPTTYGCDQAFIAFAAKRAALAYLSRILKAG